VAKIQFLDDIAEFNQETCEWECPNKSVQAHLQMVLENIVGSANDCMQHFSSRMGARVLEWDPDPRIEETLVS